MLLKKIIYLSLIVIVLLFASYTVQDQKIGKGNDKNIKYELVADWLKLPKDLILGNPTGLGIDTNQNIFIFHRAGREIYMLLTEKITEFKYLTLLVNF